MIRKIKKNTETEDLQNDEVSAVDAERYLELVKDVLENTQSNIKKALSLLREKNIDTQTLLTSLKETKAASEGFLTDEKGNERIIEGVFNGERMVGGDGVEYNIPANYASKSKLVEGDILKLTITGTGSFIYKQIGPVERQQRIALLVQDETTRDWFAVMGTQRWKLLTASVTYFHGGHGDEVVILVPNDGSTKWAAVENIIKTGSRS
ncbi:MAG: hypothetical protein PHW95_01170 [Patescibacteria group bacterium]|nr:hypothetical protein [Patescibacteria group bacterium]